MEALSTIREEWELAHEEIVAMGRSRAEQEHSLGRALLRAYRARSWARLGMGSFYEYAERYVGLKPRQTEERLRVAVSLESLPVTDGALAGGRVYWSAVREITRVATPRTEVEWVRAAVGTTVGEIERLAADRQPGDLPTDPPRRTPQRHRLVHDLTPETYALYRDVVAKLRRESDHRLSDDEIMQLMARAVLEGPGEAGRASYQIQMMVCERCGEAEQLGSGVAVAVDAAVAEMAMCDAQVLDGEGKATQSVTPKKRREVVLRQKGRCAVPGCRNATFTDVHHLVPQADGGGHDPDNLIVLCSAHHRAYHNGALLIEGTWVAGLRFMHADGSEYGGTGGDPHAGAVLIDVKDALRNMGLSDREARSVTDELRPHVGANTDVGEALNRALRILYRRNH